MSANSKNFQPNTTAKVRFYRSSPHKAKYLNKDNIPKIANKQIPLHNFGQFKDYGPQRTDQLQKLWLDLRSERQTKKIIPVPRSQQPQPVRFLKKYLHRKDKLLQNFTITVEQQLLEDNSISKKYMNKTTHEFRIKKNKKLLVQNQQNYSQIKTQSIRNQTHLDSQFLNLTNPKSLYKMSFEQLQQSIKWKKQFLDILDKKVRQAKSCQLKYRHKS